ncbi:MAG: sugar phosphate nucleotidyltransferase [Armatimonadota bacterium]|nr:sugar phosphate nucleotidyltransferase [Armatimonadota bacterium]
MSPDRKVRKAVIPAAGKGTRLLPLTRTVPKEMLPLGRKPVLHHIVDELLEAGICQVLFVISDDKTCIPRYFDDGSDRFQSVIQPRQRGLADATLYGEDFAGGDPVAVALGDSVITSGESKHVTRRLIEAYESLDAGCVIAVEEVPVADASRYGIVKPKGDAGDVFEIDDLIEKPPAGNLPSNLAIAGRYVVDPVIYDMIRGLEPGALGELQLTDAIRMLLRGGHRVWCVRLRKSEKRTDIGTFASYFEALIQACCRDEELGERMRTVAAEEIAGAAICER